MLVLTKNNGATIQMFKFGCELLFGSLHSINVGRNLEFICTCFFSLLVLVRTVKPRANGRNIVGCYMLRPFAHPVACCWILLRVVVQSLKPVPVFLLFRDRRSVAQQCWIQHCWGHARSLRMVYKDLRVVSFPRCTAGPNIVGSCCCIRLHTTANTHATTPNIVVPTMLGVM